MRGKSWCLRHLLLVMCAHPFAKEALTLHLARSEGHERYFGCNLMHHIVLASSPGLGPVVGHTTPTSSTIWIRASDRADVGGKHADDRKRQLGRRENRS